MRGESGPYAGKWLGSAIASFGGRNGLVWLWLDGHWSGPNEGVALRDVCWGFEGIPPSSDDANRQTEYPSD
jgi:hypothetical protein